MTSDDVQAAGHIGATERSFRIVELLRERGSASLAEIATEVDASKSTVHNHLATLTRLGYVTKSDGEYALGLKFLDLGDHARKRHTLYHEARGELDELVDAVGERGQVMVEENGRGVYVYQVKTDRAIQTDSHVGTTVKLHTTAVGKSYLAFCSAADRERILDGELNAETAYSITERDALLDELERIRERGYAFNDEEKVAGMRAVGAPILSADDTVLGALSVSGPTTRMNGEWYRTEVPELVVQAARVIGIKATYS